MRTQTIEEKAYWIKRVDDYKNGKFSSKAAYCVKTKVNYHRFLYWYNKIIEEQSNKDGFMPIEVTSQGLIEVAPPLCTLEFKQGHRLKIHTESVLKALINLLSK